MSISSAMQTGVSGLKANSTAVGKISDNIANANTDGYRRVFAQMVTSTSTGDETGSNPAGVRAVQGTDMETAGSLRSTGQATDLAIEGEGFFVVSKNPNDPVESNYMLTRAGSFTADEEGNLVNAAGYYLAGFPYGEDGGMGAMDRTRFGDLSSVNVGDVAMEGQPTTSLSLDGNLPAQETGAATPGDPFVSSAVFYSPLGDSERLQFSWEPTATDNAWTLNIADEAGNGYGTVDVTFADSGPNAGAPLTYGNVTSTAAAPASFAFDTATGQATLQVDNGATPQEMTIDLGAPGTFTGMTQFAGDYTPTNVDADGAAAGQLERTEIGDDGTVYGVFDNGSRSALYSIPVAQVDNPAGMISANGNAYLLSRESGGMRLNSAGEGAAGRITAGALEGSNVEIAAELTDLIQTQRAYSTNAKIVTTVDEMMDETARIKR